ncbi:unnamed protein product [Cylindrotheca closterium]|uniref:VASt domain-containing protein n=1 Tax=Cylindrotheca closterium TaxID=2856 RepID=A0AAD2G353_9STRA|nr:unnamed protein product [Cylindrotheca closterium]
MALSETMEPVGNSTEMSTDLPNNDKLEVKEETSMTSNEEEKEEESKEGSDGKIVDDNRSRKKWSELLQSPRGTECFSPSLDLSKPDSLHGIGMRLASSKSRSIGEVAHRLLIFLTEISSLYDQVGLIGFKCLQELQPSQEILFPKVLQEESNELKISLETYSMSTRQLAEYIKVTILIPLEDSLNSNGTIIANSNQRYTQVRQLCKETRSKALNARKVYLKAVKNAESSFESWKKARESTAPTLASDFEEMADDVEGWEKALTRLGANVPSNTASLIQLLKTVQSCETKYRDLVVKENKLIDEAQAVEVLGLDEIQSVVDNRFDFFVNSVGHNIMVFEEKAIGEMVVGLIEGKSPNALQSALQEKMDGALFLNNLFKQQNMKYEEGKGAMEADMLGLSQETGELRDKIQTAFATRSSRIKVVQALKSVLEAFASANSKFSKSMKTKTQTGKINPTETESLLDVAMNNIGKNSVDLIEGILRVLQTEATSTLECVDELNNIARGKLDPLLASAPQRLEAIISTEDSEWKQLCEASRSESRAETRYNQLKLQLERGRDRTASTDSVATPVDDGDSGTVDDPDDKPAGTPSRMSKIGSMLAGNDAIKKLQENAMNTITKLKDEKMGKERQAVAEASAVKDDVLGKYLSNAKQRLEKLETEDRKGWEDLKSTLESVVTTVTKLLECRQAARTSTQKSDNFTIDKMVDDVAGWLDSSKTKIIEAEQDGLFVTLNNTDTDAGYALSVAKAESKPVEALLNLKGGEDSVETLGIGQIVWPERPEEKKGTDNSSNGAQAVETKGTADRSEEPIAKNSGHKALHRSLTTPISTTQGIVKPSKQNGKSFDDSKTENDSESALRQSFIRAFWSQKEEEAPVILQTISCTYRVREKGSFLIQPVQGRVFTTGDSVYFLALDGKKLSLLWSKVTSVEVEKGILGSNDKSIVISYKLEPDANEFAFVLGRLRSRDATLEHFRELRDRKQSETATPDAPATSDSSRSSFSPVPPDKTIKKMETVLSRTIKGVPIKSLYEKVWSEGERTSEKPFYGEWLKTEGCFELQLGNWEFATDDVGFVNPWDKERYQQKRLIKFKFKRTTHLYIGPPIANVVQQQYCRVEGNDRCVMAMCLSFVGIPYADSFAVEVRWIATREGSNDVKIEVGLFVDFKRRTMLSSKIETGTISETKSVHNRLFEAVKKVCTTGGSESGDSDDEVEVEVEQVEDEEVAGGSTSTTSIFDLPLVQKLAISVAGPVIAYAIFRFAFGSRSGSTLGGSDLQLLLGKVDSLQKDVETLQKAVDALTIMLKEKR